MLSKSLLGGHCVASGQKSVYWEHASAALDTRGAGTIGQLINLRGTGVSEHFRFRGARTTGKRNSVSGSDRWSARDLRLTPWAAVLGILLLAGVAAVAHKRGTSIGKVKYIHVITSNSTGCDGLQAAAEAPPQTSGSNNGTTASSRAGLPTADAAFLQHILPLTNFSQLTSAQVLDSAAAAGMPVQQLQPLMQLHQQLWCSSRFNQQPLPGATTAKFSNVSVFMYASNDIVSNELRGRGRNWESTEVKEMLWAVREYWKQGEVFKHLPGRQNAATTVAAAATPMGSGRHLQRQQPLHPHSTSSRQPLASARPSRPLMVDVGSNVGWFAVNAAAAGARVAAFEAMGNNLALLRRTLCSNSWLAERVSLFGTGLGTEAGDCVIVSGEDNKGDGIVLCDKDPEQAVKDKGWDSTRYKVRGGITIRKLETLIQEDVQVMKMDVEGFELNVLKGAQQLLQRYNVWYIMLECNKDLVGGFKGQLEYLRYLDGLGYAISTYGFSGPFLNLATIQEGSMLLMNLYCVRKDLRQAQLAHKAGVTAPKKP